MLLHWAKLTGAAVDGAVLLVFTGVDGTGETGRGEERSNGTNFVFFLDFFSLIAAGAVVVAEGEGTSEGEGSEGSESFRGSELLELFSFFFSLTSSFF